MLLYNKGHCYIVISSSDQFSENHQYLVEIPPLTKICQVINDFKPQAAK